MGSFSPCAHPGKVKSDPATNNAISTEALNLLVLGLQVFPCYQRRPEIMVSGHRMTSPSNATAGEQNLGTFNNDRSMPGPAKAGQDI